MTGPSALHAGRGRLQNNFDDILIICYANASPNRKTHMLKPQMPNIPGVNAVTDTLDFVKNLWGSMSVPGISVPGMVAPTLSVEELDKKIADLKAVESWLNVNLSMLHGTIQALEIQRGTIATLKSMGAALASAVQQPGANEKSVLAAAPYASAFFPPPAEPRAALRAEPKPEPKIERAPEAPAAPEPTAQTAQAAAQLANPNAWWNMLQDQFKQAVTTAMSSEAMTGATARAQDAASKLAEAGAEQVAKLGKTVPKAAAQSTGASASAPAKKAAPAKVASKRTPVKPGTSKPKAGKSNL